MYSCPVERIYSASGEVTREKRNRLSDGNLERETAMQTQNLFCFEVQRNCHAYRGQILPYELSYTLELQN